MADNAKASAGEGAPKKTTTRRRTTAKNPVGHENAKETVAESLAELAQSKGRDVNGNLFSDSGSNSEQESTAPAKRERAAAPAMTTLLFQEPDVEKVTRRPKSNQASSGDTDGADVETPAEDSGTGSDGSRRRRRGTRGGRRPANDADQNNSDNEAQSTDDAQDHPSEDSTSGAAPAKRTRVRSGRSSASSNAAKRSSGSSDSDSGHDEATDSHDSGNDDGDITVRRRRRRRSDADEVTAPKGSTRLEAKRQRRREGRQAGRRRQTITESEYLARRESVERDMLVREQDGLNQIAVLEDNVLVEHFVARHTQSSMVGNVYLGRVQNVLPSMEAAFIDIGKGRNAVLYAGEVNWEAAGMEGKPRKIEQALKSGDTVLVQVTKDPIGHKGARLTSQITLAGRHLVLVPSGAMTGISRKLPEKERTRLKRILKEIVPEEHGVIVRTAAEGATEEQLREDIERLTKSWEDISAKAKSTKNAPSLLKGEPELAVRVVRDIFNEDFRSLKVSGDTAWETISEYVHDLSPELEDRLEHWTDSKDIFAANRIDEQLQKAFDRKVFLPSGGSLVIDRTEAMTVIDVNTGKFTGSGGSLEETVTMNNLEAAEEIVRQLRLRDIGGIIVIDFIDMVLEANRDLVLRRLIECLGRDRTRHQVAEVTSLGLVQMTRKRVGQGLVEAFSTTCEVCEGSGYITHEHPVERGETTETASKQDAKRHRHGGSGTGNGTSRAAKQSETTEPEDDVKHTEVKNALNNIAAAAAQKAEPSEDTEPIERPEKAESAEPDEEAEPTESAEPDEKAEQAEKAEKPAAAPRKRRVSSSGTITPASSASSALMTFPAKKTD